MKLVLIENGNIIEQKEYTRIEDPDDVMNKFELWMQNIGAKYPIPGSQYKIEITF